MIPHKLARAPIVDRERFLLEAARGKSVLHLGCADAPYFGSRDADVSLLHTRLATVATRIVGIDIDEEGVRFFRNSLGFKEVFLGDVEALSEAKINGTFDLVLAGELLEHLPNPGLCLVAVENLLRPDGSLIITVPNAFSLKGFMRVIRGVELIHPDHVCYFSVVTIKRLLAQCGYSVVTYAYYVSRSASKLKRAIDFLFLAPARCCAPYLSDGIVVVAKLVR